MEKTFFFMGGLPRSGSTLLTAILNQHPDVYASPQSHLIDMYFRLQTSIYESEPYKTGLRNKEYDNVLASLGNLFYSDIKKPFIIDKNRAWGTPGNRIVAQALNNKPKTILMMRPILEVLASFIRLAEKNPNNFIDSNIANMDFYSSYYKDTNDVRCEYLMRSFGEIDQALLAIATLIQDVESCHLVWYQDLISNPQKTLEDIYTFLELNNFNHNFEQIKQIDNHKDENVFGIKTLHKIKSSIQENTINVELFLSKDVISKYENTLNFIPR
jgi:sulfotransferase